MVKRFDGRTILDGINLDVFAGETLVIMGGSGSGKSTLLRILIGSIQPDEGTVDILGRNIAQIDERALDEVRKKFGILFQSGALFNSLTLRENVALPLEEHTLLKADTIDIIVKIKLELVGLREHADKYPAQISGGMKKRAGLARALALDPQILFYDEPSAGLDPVTSAEIDQLIINLSKQLGVTSVVVTHEMDSAFRIADRMAMLDKGRMLLVESRDYFIKLREAAVPANETAALIHQFVRLATPKVRSTQRQEPMNYEEDLLGKEEDPQPPDPAVRTCR